MTKIQKTILILSITIYVIGGMFKIMHWPYSSLIQIIGLLSALIFFIPFLAISRFSTKPSGRLLYYYLSGFLSIILILIGDILEKSKLDANLGMIIGLPGIALLILVFLPICFKLNSNSIYPDLKKKYRNRIILVIIYIVFLLITAVIPLILTSAQQKDIRHRYEDFMDSEKLSLKHELENFNGYYSSIEMQGGVISKTLLPNEILNLRNDSVLEVKIDYLSEIENGYIFNFNLEYSSYNILVVSLLDTNYSLTDYKFYTNGTGNDNVLEDTITFLTYDKDYEKDERYIFVEIMHPNNENIPEFDIDGIRKEKLIIGKDLQLLKE